MNRSEIVIPVKSPQDLRQEDVAFVALVAKLGSDAARFQDEPVIYRSFAPRRRGA